MQSGTPLDSLTHDAVAPSWWARPDPALAAAGIEGEFVVARVRVVAMGLLLLAPAWNLLHFPEQAMHIAGFVVTLTAALASVVIWWTLRDGRWRPWVGFASSAFDVSMVSLALLSFLLVASPLVALNSTVTFEMYFLAILGTSLRYDARICLVTGGLAVSEYGVLWLHAATQYDLHSPLYAVEAGPYTPVDTATRLLLLAVATILAVTLVRRAQRLLYLASHDRLTGLFNRGHFDRMLAATSGAARDEQSLAVAILDIDHFKEINDAHGHPQGDEALRRLADFLSRAMRHTDVVARYGGEEFVILMAGTSRAHAAERVERLRVELAGTPLLLGTGATFTLNFSAGIAGAPDDALGSNPQALVLVADRRLLLAKRSGRGCCVADDAIMPSTAPMDASPAS